jgi:hypothetical protein
VLQRLDSDNSESHNLKKQIEKELLATASDTKYDIKTDVMELAAIAIEDKISKEHCRTNIGIFVTYYKASVDMDY